jgi:hypothetical protein
MNTNLTIAFMLALGSAACTGEEAVSYSDMVGIEVKADADKVVADNISDEKNINTESGNPYGAFITAAQNELGADPGRIEITSVTIQLNDAVGVSALNEIFDGDVDVIFQMPTSGDEVRVASGLVGADTQGGGPIELIVEFDSDSLNDANYADLIAGSFKVLYRAPANPAYAATSAKTDLQITFMFEAFE